MKAYTEQFKSIRFSPKDLQSSLVVFLVALPLCLGIALASGAPAASGLIAGIIGGLIVGFLSPSEVSVSGPAAGLTVVVLAGIQTVGSFETFCAVTAVAGLMQLILAGVRFGLVGSLIPSSVIKGMLAAIGILIILKQIPHAIGFDADYFGDESFLQNDGDNTFSALTHALSSTTTGAILISLFSFFVLLFWDRFAGKTPLKVLPSALIAVALAVIANEFVLPLWGLQLTQEHLVQVPDTSLFVFRSPLDVLGLFQSNFFGLALTLCLIGSIETILSIDASEKIDPLKRSVDPTRELFAQGIGNFASGLLGGLPVTAVIVRSSANVTAGAQTRLSGILHATWLLLFALAAPDLLNKIPLSVLAMVLIFVGFKLTTPKIYHSYLKQGLSQLIPFLVTILAILLTDLLVGVLIGFVVGLVFVFKNNLHASVLLVHDDDGLYLLRFNKDTSFLNKPILKKLLAQVPKNSELLIDGSRAVFIDTDIINMVEDFVEAAPQKNIKVQIRKSSLALSPFFKD